MRSAPGRIVEIACWAHCRRKNFDAWEATQSPIAKEALDRIAALYAIEAEARFKPAAERLVLRTATRALIGDFIAWADTVLRKLSAKSALAEAFRYTTRRGAALTRLLDHGELEIDNNHAENSLRGIAARAAA